MNESDYDLLASTCDRLLRAPGTDRARLAIGLLHVIHEHPSWLAQYRNVFMPGGRRLRDRRLIRGARDLYRMARGIRTSLWSVPNPTAAGARDASPDVLIVSRLTSDAQLARGDDFYFGAMPDLLRARRANVIVALVDHRYSTGHGESTAPGLGQLLLPKWLPPHDELALWKQCAGSRAALAGEAHAMRDPFDRALARLAAEEALSAVTAANLRLHARVKEICFRLRPRIVLTTFEGDASERMIFLGARQSGVEPLCVGYQHTRLLPRAHAIKRALAVSGLPCDPDVVLTLGEETRTRLESAAPPGTRYITYGSHRRIVRNTPPARDPRAACCLVLPDAEPSEHTMLFEFAVACARRSPDIAFIFRPHPVGGENLQRMHRITPSDLPANMRVDAHESLQLQADRARCCLYRASSAVFHAALAGARPLYVARPDEMPFDPLVGLSCRTSVSCPEEVAARTAEGGWACSDDFAATWNYCDRYVAQLRPSALDELLMMPRPVS